MPNLKTKITDKDLNIEHLVYASPIAMYTCDKDGYLTFFNDAAVELWGRTPEIGKDLWCGSWKIYSTDGKPMPLDQCPMALTLKQQRSFAGAEIRIERPDHIIKSLLVYPRPIFDDKGVLAGAQNTLVDISEQKMEEEKKYILSAIVESSDDAIVSKNLDGIITSWNNGAQKIFEYTGNEIIGKHISTLIPPELQDEEVVIIANIKAGNKVDHFRTVRLSKTGKKIPVSITVSPVKDSKGNIIGASKIARDISDQVEKEKAIKELHTKKDEFIALASHELKTPLTTINGYLQIMQENEKDPVSKLFLEKSLKQSDKLNTLISDMLDISRIGMGKLWLNYERFDLNKLLEDVIETFSYSLPTHRVILNESGPAIFIEADRQRIEQVITNLLSNAIKYSPNADLVTVNIAASAMEATVTVKDKGIGLDKEAQEKIFTKFYRAVEKSNISGLGLGLYITKEIIDRHNGKIDVKSEPGNGAEFFFSIPVKLQH
jgi:PAS domain S-box-containing protein